MNMVNVNFVFLSFDYLLLSFQFIVDSGPVVLNLVFPQKWSDEMIIFNAHKVVCKNGSEDELIVMQKPSTAVHVVILPHSEVSVSRLSIADMWPYEQAISLLDAVHETTAVLAAIFIHHMSFTSLFIKRPIASIPSLLLSINLNAETVAQRLQFVFKFFCYQCDILYNSEL